MSTRGNGLACAAAIVVAFPSWAGDWTEVGDAPEFPAGEAQPVHGAGALTTITGQTNTADDDFVDAYLIMIDDAENFYATTSSAWDPLASCVWDTRLYLFDPDAAPLLGNDDAPGAVGTQSYVSDPLLFQGVVDPTAQPLADGIHVLIITGYANAAVDAAGTTLIDVGADYDALFGPNPEAGPFDHWNNFHAMVQSGAYTIALAGASFLPSCPADVTGPAGTPDGVVNVLDLLAVIGAWGQSGVPEDINGDGTVDVLDLLAVIAAWGPC